MKKFAKGAAVAVAAGALVLATAVGAIADTQWGKVVAHAHHHAQR